MKMSEVKRVLEELAFKVDVTVALVGERGIGKNAVIEQVAQERGIGYASLCLALLEPSDIQGLPVPDETKRYVRYLLADLIPTEANVRRGLFPQEGILHIEELNRAEAMTLNAVMSVLLERKVHGHSLAPGWRLVASMNPIDGGYAVTELDEAVRDRMLFLLCQPDAAVWMQYQRGRKDADPDILAFIEACPEALFARSTESIRHDAKPTPRSWEWVMQIRQRCDFPPDLMTTVLAGLIGFEQAVSLMGFLRDREQPIDPEAVLEDYDGVRQRLVGLLETERYDLVHASIERFVDHLAREARPGDHQKAVHRFAEDLPDEMRVVLARRMTSKPKLARLLLACGHLREHLTSRYEAING